MSHNPVAVYNNMDHPYTETFNDQTLTIQPGKSIEMNRSEAIVFLGRNPGINPNTRELIQKNLEIRPISDKTKDITGAAEIENTFRCMLDGKVFATQAALDAHLTEHSGLVAKDPTIPEPEKPTTKGKIKCPLCVAEMDNARAMASHMGKHIKEENALVKE
jgi:hypothetical protein